MSTPAALRVFEGRARTYRHTWRGSAISTFLQPVLFLSAMGLGLGQLVDRGDAVANLNGLTYLAFLAPGLLIATAMQTGASDSAWPVLASIKWIKTYDAALATPIRTGDLVTGHLLWVAARLVLVSVVYVAIMAGFGAVTVGAGLTAVVPAVLTGMAFAAPTTAFTARLQNDIGLTNLFRFGILPLYLFSGTFFPISQLPAPIQPLAYLVPTWHGVELARSITGGTAPAWPAGWHVASLLVCVAAGWWAADRAFAARLET